MQIRLLGIIWSYALIGTSVNPGSNVALRQRKGKRPAAAQYFSSGKTSGISNATQIISHQRKI